LTGILAGWGRLEELATQDSAGEFINVFSSGFSHAPPFSLPLELNVRLFALGSVGLRGFVIDVDSLLGRDGFLAGGLLTIEKPKNK
jgi:hypothetical protein